MKKYILVPLFMVAMTGASPSGIEPVKDAQMKSVPISVKVDSINKSVQSAIDLDIKL